MENGEGEKIPPKKKNSGLVKFITFLAIVGVIVLGLGFIFPGLLWQQSLGISYTTEDYNSILEKLSYIKDAAPTEGTESDYTYIYGSIKPVDVEFTSEELTAFFNENRPSYYALKNVQIRINNDGTIEASANANVDYFLDEVLGGEYSRYQINQQIPALGMLPSNVNLYLKFSGSVTDNKTTIDVSSASVQGIEIPSVYVNSSEAMSVLSSGCDNVMNTFSSKTGSTFNKISVEGGVIKFKGSVPSSLERIEN